MSTTAIIAGIVKILVVFGVQLGSVAVLVYLERRVSAFIQSRYGPNRVGPFGLLQPMADMVKLFFKEEFYPANANRLVFMLSPVMAMAPAFLMMAVIPFGSYVVIAGEPIKLVCADLGMGVLLVLGASSLTVYGLTMGGWSSGSKYSLMGGVRGTAQMISYELSLGLAVVSVLLLSDGFSLWDIAMKQSGGIFHWYIFRQPLAFFIFLIAIFAETNRLPFDLPEADSELVSGYHTEYSSMKFAFFFMGEYAAMAAGAAMMVVLFLGGWHFPGMGLLGLEGWPLAIVGMLVFVAKVGIILLFFIQVRWTLPRFRYDQLMNLGWKVLLPLGLINVLLTGLLVSLDVF
ncbi:MAG: NADH-quinone oxidoreductase subunit NuoH [Planctomycetota bacterium]|jgi:NADH-quinone oxidoreductase subunit H